MKIINQILIVVLFFTFWNCTNPFSTRSPEEPNPTGNQQTFNLQTDPDSLLSKLRQSFSTQDRTDYEECLASELQGGPGLVFIPENREVVRLADWDLADEGKYFQKLIDTDDLQEIDISFYDKSQWIITSADSQQIRFSYKITLKFITETEMYQGRCLIKILRSSTSLWYIYYWEDFRLESNDQSDTWSTLKADYRI
jgi:hypothetical protein